MPIRRIARQALARLAARWPTLSDKMVTAFSPVECTTVPWCQVTKPLERSKVVVVTTAGIHHESQQPFDMTDPDGDPYFRIIDPQTIEKEYRITHDYYDHRDADQDLNIVFPISRLKELQNEGYIGNLSEWHFSFMGHITGNHVQTLVNRTGPQVARILNELKVDVVLLTPA